MTRLINVAHLSPTRCCEELELGNILFFPMCPFHFPQDSLTFLLNQRQRGSRNRKNIAYKPSSDKITNFVHETHSQAETLLEIMRTYSKQVTTLLSTVLAPYAPHWKVDYASFRPFQEQGRKLRTRARNDLLHFDAFPSRPLHGGRILRFFININPIENRCWTTSDTFPYLVKRFAGKDVPIPQTDTLSYKISKLIKKATHKIGLPVPLRSPYDTFMLNFHNFLKENDTFQDICAKNYFEFPPLSCWAVFTDGVSHAATSGQYALEQTLIIPQHALLKPESSPLRELEHLAGRSMLDPELM